MAMEYAKKLRQSMTDAERHLWQHLRCRQIESTKFRRQHPIENYIVDFVCIEKQLVVEIDGSQHIEQQTYDKKRTKRLNQLGFRVIRFWNNEVLLQTEAVLEKIRQELIAPSPQPLSP
jgi:very-short-patch-repair endonuclease